VADYRYIIGPYLWRDDPLGGGYVLPDGAIGSLDVGSVAEMGVIGGHRRCGLFWLPADAAFDAGVYSDLGRGDCRDLKSDAAMVSAWESLSGYSPSGETLVDLAWDHMTAGSDPDGLDGPYPLRPLRTGFLRLVFAGHSEVKRERFEWGKHPHWAKVRDSYKRLLGVARGRSVAGEFRNPLPDAAGKRFQVDREFHLGVAQAAMEILAACGLTDFKDIRPNGWGRNEKPRAHGTTVSDNFNRSNQNELGSSSEGWAWSIYPSNSWDILSKQAACDTQGTTLYARCGTSLAGDGHYSQVELAAWTPSSTQAGVMAAVLRIGASMVQNHGRYQVNAYDGESNTRKVVAGSTTTLSGPTTVTVGSLPGLVYHQYDESDAYVSKYKGSTIHTGTDTSHQGSLDVGMLSYEGSGTTLAADNFAAGDLAAAFKAYLAPRSGRIIGGGLG